MYIDSIDDKKPFSDCAFLIRTDLSLNNWTSIVNSIYDQIGAQMRTENWNWFYDIMRSKSYWSVDIVDNDVFRVISWIRDLSFENKELYTDFFSAVLSISQWNDIKIILVR